MSSAKSQGQHKSFCFYTVMKPETEILNSTYEGSKNVRYLNIWANMDLYTENNKKVTKVI